MPQVLLSHGVFFARPSSASPAWPPGTDAYADSQCRMCLEFVQRAAAGLRPKNFCKAIPSASGAKSAQCPGRGEGKGFCVGLRSLMIQSPLRSLASAHWGEVDVRRSVYYGVWGPERPLKMRWRQ